MPELAPQGTVKWCNDAKGYDLVSTSDCDVFVHHSGIQGSGFKPLAEGDKVSFDTEAGPKGPKAVNVVKFVTSEARKIIEDDDDEHFGTVERDMLYIRREKKLHSK